MGEDYSLDRWGNRLLACEFPGWGRKRDHEMVLASTLDHFRRLPGLVGLDISKTDPRISRIHDHADLGACMFSRLDVACVLEHDIHHIPIGFYII